VFDDVWSVHFWDDIEFAVIDNRKGSKILITTRNMNVAMSCKKSSFVEVHELQPLTIEQSLELFNKKAFRFDIDACCLKEFTSISLEIVQKCKGLPLAKEKNMVEWRRFSETLSYELKKDSQLIEIKKL
jgi:disease resistance protein RPM1